MGTWTIWREPRNVLNGGGGEEGLKIGHELFSTWICRELAITCMNQFSSRCKCVPQCTQTCTPMAPGCLRVVLFSLEACSRVGTKSLAAVSASSLCSSPPNGSLFKRQAQLDQI